MAILPTAAIPPWLAAGRRARAPRRGCQGSLAAGPERDGAAEVRLRPVQGALRAPGPVGMAGALWDNAARAALPQIPCSYGGDYFMGNPQSGVLHGGNAL